MFSRNLITHALPRGAAAVVRRAQAAALSTAAPTVKPASPDFSSGPCKKRPGWSPAIYETAAVGRSHRSKLGKAKLAQAIDDTRRLLNIPADYHIGIVPASDTGAIEMAMWSMLGERPVDMCYWESFGKGWLTDVEKQLKLDGVRTFSADYGALPDLAATSPDHDVVFTFNGTTSGVRVPNLDWVSAERSGLTFNDATSAVFAMEFDWTKCDVTTYSWQKVLGGEGAHGMLVLSPAAVARLESYTPDRPLPKIFQMVKGGKLMAGIFKGETINTPSLVCVEDYLDALAWVDSIGGVPGCVARSEANLAVLADELVGKNDWCHFLAADAASRSNTSVCLTLDTSPENVKKMAAFLEAEDVAYDIGAYRDAPAGLRIWCGATVEAKDLSALVPWIEHAYHKFK